MILVPFHEYHFRISTERSCYRNKNLFLLHEFRKLGAKFEETILFLPLSVTKFPNKKEMGRRFEHIRFLNQRVSSENIWKKGLQRCRSVSPSSSSSSSSSNSVRSAFSDRLNPETSPRIKGSQGLKGTEEEEEEERERLRERVSSRLSRDWKFRLRRDFDLNLYETGRKVSLLVHRKCDLHACGLLLSRF